MKSTINEKAPVSTANDEVSVNSILAQLDKLETGDTLRICMDYDLEPLHQQLLEKKGENFSWKYTEHGPHWWKVNISKN